MKRGWCVTLLLIAACSGSALAQGFSAKSLELSIGEGLSSRSSKTFQIGPPQSSSPIDEEMKFDTNRRHEMRLNFFTSKRFGTEGFYGYETTNVIFNRLTEPAETLAVPLQIHHFGLNVLYFPIGTSESKWRPFLTAGGGAMIYRPTGSGQDAATDPLRGNLSTFIESSRGSFNYGGGLKRTLGKSFGLRFDLANVMTAVPTFGLDRSSTQPNASVLPVSGRLQNLQASVGFILYLGK